MKDARTIQSVREPIILIWTLVIGSVVIQIGITQLVEEDMVEQNKKRNCSGKMMIAMEGLFGQRRSHLLPRDQTIRFQNKIRNAKIVSETWCFNTHKGLGKQMRIVISRC